MNPPFAVQKIGHAVVNVADLEKSKRFYTEVLGFKVSDIYPDKMMPGGMVFLRCNGDHHCLALIGGDTRFDLVAVDVFLETAKIQTNHARVSLEQSARVLRFTPDRLLLIKQIVHFPKTILHPGRFGRARRLLGMDVNSKRQMAKDHTQLRLVIFLQLLDLRRDSTARRTLEIAEFLQRY